MKLKQVFKVPVYFDAYDAKLEHRANYPPAVGPDYRDELGNYDWFLYQYKIKDRFIDVHQIKESEKFRRSLIPFGQFKYAKVVSFDDFFSFLIENYKGCAPYAKGMNIGRATDLSKKLLSTFLVGKPNEAIYIEYARTGIAKEVVQEVDAPYLISGIYGILDANHHEFFVLILGGGD